MIMLNRATEEPPGQDGGRSESRLAPALAWAVGGGGVILAVSLLLYVLAVSMGEWLAGTPQQAMTRLASAPMYREFAGLFLASSLAIFITREFGVRTR
jgi:hypothetical protein